MTHIGQYDVRILMHMFSSILQIIYYLRKFKFLSMTLFEPLMKYTVTQKWLSGVIE